MGRGINKSMNFSHSSLAAILEMAQNPVQARKLAEYLQEIDAAEIVDWLYELAELVASGATSDPPGLGPLVAAVAGRFRHGQGSEEEATTEALGDAALALYRQLPQGAASRGHLLALFAQVSSGEGLERLADQLAEDPPGDPMAASQAILPLFSRENYDPQRLFPRLLDALAHPSIAAAVLDLANHLTQRQRVERHPASQRSEQLIEALGCLVGRLGKLEEQPTPADDAVLRQVDDSVSLVISLCYALALVGDEKAIGKLNQALELGHRRIRIEAAYALAKLGATHGVEGLLALAAEPMVRPRVIAYAEDLGVADRLEERYTSPAARAEGELASWLALPTNLGLAPSRLETIEERELYWPGYEDPVECFLVRFTYELPPRVYSNVGIVGPLTHAFTADLSGLAPGDIFAAFAGWQAEHDEIFQLDLARVSGGQQVEVDRLVRRLRDARYENIEPVTLGFFFGQRVLLADAEREGVPGTAIADGEELFWFPEVGQSRPLGADVAYSIYKGRKLLRTFND